MASLQTEIISNAGPAIAGILGVVRPMEATYLIGSILTAAGIYGVLNPIPLAHLFGIPFADATHALFAPAVAGRNTAAGLMLLTLRFLRERRALGVVMACWTLAGLSDIWILLTTEGGENVRTHAVNVGVLLVVSYRLLSK